MEPHKAVAAVRWNPANDTELAVAFKHWAEVYLYDLEAWSASPTKIYRVGHKVKGSAGGNLSLLFVPQYHHHSSGPAAGGTTTMRRKATSANVIAGSVYGMLRCWHLSKPHTAMWETKGRGVGGE